MMPYMSLYFILLMMLMSRQPPMAMQTSYIINNIFYSFTLC